MLKAELAEVRRKALSRAKRMKSIKRYDLWKRELALLIKDLEGKSNGTST